MKTLKAIGLIFYYVTLRVIFSPFWFTVWVLKVIETTIRIIKETLTFFIKQIESEVF